jgi:hypothetical protein
MKLSFTLLSLLFFVIATTAPTVFAQNATILDGETVFQGVVTNIFGPIYKLMIAIAGLYFLYGVAKFIYDMNDPEKKTFGKSHLLWGTVGLFIILSVGGILPALNNMVGGMFSY